MKRRISTPRAATVVVLAAVVAFAATVVPSLAGSFLTNQKAAKLYLSNKKASKVYLSNKNASANYLKKKAASNLYVAKKTATPPPVGAVAAGTAPFGPIVTTTAGYIPGVFASFATKANVSNVVITFSGQAACTSEKGTPDQACPIQILVDGQSTGKVNFSPATTAPAKGAAAVVQTVMQSSVLTKGGHTVSVQYAGAAGLTFTLKGWNLAVEAYPQPDESLTTETTSGGGK